MSVIIRKRICTPSETAIDFWAPAHQHSPELDSDAELLPVINRACLFVDRSFPLEVVVRKKCIAQVLKKWMQNPSKHVIFTVSLE